MSRTSPSLSTARQTYTLSAVDGDKRFVEMPAHVRPRPSSSQLAGNGGAELQSPTADRLVGHIDTSLGEHVLDVTVAQSEAEIEPEGLLDDDARIAVAMVGELGHLVYQASALL